MCVCTCVCTCAWCNYCILAETDEREYDGEPTEGSQDGGYHDPRDQHATLTLTKENNFNIYCNIKYVLQGRRQVLEFGGA